MGFSIKVGYDDPNIPIALSLFEKSSMVGEITDLYQPLNVRLGYPWNGVEHDLSRVNPKPLQNVIYPYYAQSYGNLLHTHNIFLYSDITGGSTQDTNQEMPLLAVVPVDVEQLGIVHFTPSTDNKLSKIPDYIYEITIHMKTDTGAEYYLPNSAPVNLELSFSY